MIPPSSSEGWNASFNFDDTTNNNTFTSGDFVAIAGVKNVFSDEFIPSTIPESKDYDESGPIFESEFGFKFTADG